MKVKMFQLLGLFILVMSINFMTHIQKGFGHDLTGNHTNMSHPPEFYVDYWTGKTYGSNTHMYLVDPRSFSTFSGSSGNGTGSASSWALEYYATSRYSGDGGKVDTPADPDNSVQKQRSDLVNKRRISEPEMIIAAKIDLSASAGNSSCSGSAQPYLTDDMGLNYDEFSTGWAGQAKLDLQIPAKEGVHELVIIPNPEYGASYACVPRRNVTKSSYDPGWQDISIEISNTKLSKKTSKGIEASLSSGPATFSGHWTVENSVEKEGIYAYPTGIEVTLGVPFDWIILNRISQLDKSANVKGYIGRIHAPEIDAKYSGSHVCINSLSGSFGNNCNNFR